MKFSEPKNIEKEIDFWKKKTKYIKEKNRKTKAAMHKLSWKILAKSLNIIFAKFKTFKNGYSTFCVIFQIFSQSFLKILKMFK